LTSPRSSWLSNAGNGRPNISTDDPEKSRAASAARAMRYFLVINGHFEFASD